MLSSVKFCIKQVLTLNIWIIFGKVIKVWSRKLQNNPSNIWLFQTKSKQGRHTFLKIPPEIFYFLTLPLKIPDKTPPLEIPGFSLLERWGESSPQAKNVLIPPPPPWKISPKVDCPHPLTNIYPLHQKSTPPTLNNNFQVITP